MQAAGNPRVLLFTGKGGVGKTTTAAATALRCGESGLRTLVLSTDPAHSLADAFGGELGPLVAPVAEGLWGQQLDPQDRMEDSWAEIQRYLVEVFRWAGVEAIEAEELSVVPGLDEVFALADIRQHASSGDWDVLVVDCAPTAETIRLLSLPDILGRYMERVFPIGRRVSRVVSPLVARMTTLPVADDGVFDPWFARWKALHAEHLATIDEGFAPVPVLRVALQPDEPVGLDALRSFADALYGDEDPTARYGVSDPLRVSQRGGGAVLEIDLPFTDREEIELGRRGDELLVRVGPYRRGRVLRI